MALALAGCVSPGTIRLAEGEVREYEGERLSSISDFRENSIKGPQVLAEEDYRLVIDGLVGHPVNLSYQDVLRYQKYSKAVRLDCVEGWSVDILWEGVLVRDILEEAEVLPQANTVIFYASDGYSTSFPIEYVLENEILLAAKMNGVTLPPERGFPFQLVAESKWGYKWIKWVTRIELSEDASYKGYWERRGYSDSGDLDSHFRD